MDYFHFSNIDVRIRAAEMEYELEREELNILNLREEIGVLQSRLQETLSAPSPTPFINSNITVDANIQNVKPTTTDKASSPMTPTNEDMPGSARDLNSLPRLAISFHSTLSSSESVSGNFQNAILVAVTIHNTPGNPPFHVTSQPAPISGCFIDWATDDTRLKKGDR